MDMILAIGRTYRDWQSAALRGLTNPFALIAFAFGLWFGYLGAVDRYRSCHRADAQVRTVACPSWMRAR